MSKGSGVEYTNRVGSSTSRLDDFGPSCDHFVCAKCRICVIRIVFEYLHVVLVVRGCAEEIVRMKATVEHEIAKAWTEARQNDTRRSSSRDADESKDSVGK